MTANVGRCRLNEDIVVERELARPVRKRFGTSLSARDHTVKFYTGQFSNR